MAQELFLRGPGTASSLNASHAEVTGLMGRAYQRRITAEEKLLQHALPEYGSYRRHTKKLIPLIW
ncbi:MAG TPA: hypothetical protein VGG53_13900 [Mycobacterium sp.]|uniref:hypothetical protein n=1 Tax=Mycobacterium sp. TaxID=1785 RepID=UPI002F40EB75